MSIGYACLTLGVPLTKQKSCTKKYASEEKLRTVIAHNLEALEHIIEYNNENNIHLFRISSDIIPFGSSPVNQLPWEIIYKEKFKKIGDCIKRHKIRVSMHPGQYTVLNSPNKEVVARAIEDLNYHAKVLDSLGVGQEHKIVLHIGGVYQDKQAAIKRFVANYQQLEDNVKRRLVIENDDKSYMINEVLNIGEKLSIPVVFDNLHHKINQCPQKKSEYEWIEECSKTWKEEDGIQKIHYSQQNLMKSKGAHSETINLLEFLDFYKALKRNDLDIMLEVKDKNISALKCISATVTEQNIKVLEREWSRYKYLILEKDPNTYTAIRKLLKDKSKYPVNSFYSLIEQGLNQKARIGNAVNAAQHVWGYFKGKATIQEQTTFLNNITNFQKGSIPITRIKRQLGKAALKYKEVYLLESYYFLENY